MPLLTTQILRLQGKCGMEWTPHYFHNLTHTHTHRFKPWLKQPNLGGYLYNQIGYYQDFIQKILSSSSFRAPTDWQCNGYPDIRCHDSVSGISLAIDFAAAGQVVGTGLHRNTSIQVSSLQLMLEIFIVTWQSHDSIVLQFCCWEGWVNAGRD